MDNNHAQAVLDRIKKECIKPESHFKICWKSHLFWLIFITTALLGMVFFSFVLIELSDIDSHVMRRLPFLQLTQLLFTTAPYFWILFAVGSIAIGIWAFRWTRRSYRFSVLFIAGTTIFVISLGAFALHIWRVNEQIEDSIARGLPGLQSMNTPFQDRWSHPDQGLLGGKVENVDAQHLIIFSFDGKLWTVSYTEKTILSPEKPINIGEMVRIIGEKIGQEKFRADIIRHRTARYVEQRTRPWHMCDKQEKEEPLDNLMQTPQGDDVYNLCGHQGTLAPQGSPL